MNAFSPFISLNWNTKNRWVMAPMTRRKCPMGIPDIKVEQYYRKMAQSNLGTIISEGICIPHEFASAHEAEDVPIAKGSLAIKQWQKIIKNIHDLNCKIVAQLWHIGSTRPKQSIAPQAIQHPFGDNVPRTMNYDKSEQNRIIQAYKDGTQWAIDCGFDAIEIHGAHGYLIDQFFWEKTNPNLPFKLRMNFPLEIIHSIKKMLPSKIPLFFRLSQWKQGDYTAKITNNDEELSQWVLPLSHAGVDIFDCSTRKFWQDDFAKKIKQITMKPTVAVGGFCLEQNINQSIFHYELLEKSLNQNEFDFFAIGRALLADEQLIEKIHQNKFEKINFFEKKHLYEFP